MHLYHAALVVRTNSTDRWNKRYVRTTPIRNFLPELSENRSSVRPGGKPQTYKDETAMTHSLLGADRATHFKIVAVAVAGAVAVALVGMNSAVSERDAVAGRVKVSSVVLKAGKPAISAALEVTTMR
jgi:hypothetical protein